MGRDYRACSLWLDTLGEPIVARAALSGEESADVVIVGGGFIGLWTAYCLAAADAALRIVLLEAEIAGYGAAGRNAGFVSAGIAGQSDAYLPRGGWEGIQRAERAMIDGIDFIGGVVAREGIDCGWLKGGSLRLATSPAQLERIRAGLDGRRSRGLTDADVQLLDPGEIAARVRIPGVIGARTRRTARGCTRGGWCVDSPPHASAMGFGSSNAHARRTSSRAPSAARRSAAAPRRSCTRRRSSRRRRRSPSRCPANTGA